MPVEDDTMGMGVEVEGQEDEMVNQQIQRVIEAAKTVGFDENAAMQGGANPQMYQELLKRASESEWGATDDGINTIVGVSQMLQVPSPYRRGPDTEQAPDYAQPFRQQ